MVIHLFSHKIFLSGFHVYHPLVPELNEHFFMKAKGKDDLFHDIDVAYAKQVFIMTPCLEIKFEELKNILNRNDWMIWKI